MIHRDTRVDLSHGEITGHGSSVAQANLRSAGNAAVHRRSVNRDLARRRDGAGARAVLQRHVFGTRDRAFDRGIRDNGCTTAELQIARHERGILNLRADGINDAALQRGVIHRDTRVDLSHGDVAHHGSSVAQANLRSAGNTAVHRRTVDLDRARRRDGSGARTDFQSHIRAANRTGLRGSQRDLSVNPHIASRRTREFRRSGTRDRAFDRRIRDNGCTTAELQVARHERGILKRRADGTDDAALQRGVIHRDTRVGLSHGDVTRHGGGIRHRHGCSVLDPAGIRIGERHHAGSREVADGGIRQRRIGCTRDRARHFSILRAIFGTAHRDVAAAKGDRALDARSIFDEGFSVAREGHVAYHGRGGDIHAQSCQALAGRQFRAVGGDEVALLSRDLAGRVDRAVVSRDVAVLSRDIADGLNRAALGCRNGAALGDDVSGGRLDRAAIGHETVARGDVGRLDQRTVARSNGAFRLQIKGDQQLRVPVNRQILRQIRLAVHARDGQNGIIHEGDLLDTGQCHDRHGGVVDIQGINNHQAGIVGSAVCQRQLGNLRRGGIQGRVLAVKRQGLNIRLAENPELSTVDKRQRVKCNAVSRAGGHVDRAIGRLLQFQRQITAGNAAGHRQRRVHQREPIGTVDDEVLCLPSLIEGFVAFAADTVGFDEGADNDIVMRLDEGVGIIVIQRADVDAADVRRDRVSRAGDGTIATDRRHLIDHNRAVARGLPHDGIRTGRNGHRRTLSIEFADVNGNIVGAQAGTVGEHRLIIARDAADLNRFALHLVGVAGELAIDINTTVNGRQIVAVTDDVGVHHEILTGSQIIVAAGNGLHVDLIACDEHVLVAGNVFRLDVELGVEVIGVTADVALDRDRGVRRGQGVTAARDGARRNVELGIEDIGVTADVAVDRDRVVQRGQGVTVARDGTRHNVELGVEVIEVTRDAIFDRD